MNSARRYGLATAILAGAIALSAFGFGVPRYHQVESVLDVHFFMGPTARSLLHEGSLCTGLPLDSLQIVGGSQAELSFCTHRRPLVPTILAATALIGASPVLLLGLKSALFGWMAFCSLRELGKALEPTWHRVLLVAWALMAYQPFALSQSAGIEVEEAYAIPILLATFTILARPRLLHDQRWCVVAGLCVSSLLLLKSSYLLLGGILFLSLCWSAPHSRSFLRASIPCISLALGGLMCLSFSSGRLHLGSSLDWWNVFKGNNPAVLLHPRHLSLDTLVIQVPPGTSFLDEWALSDYFRSRTIEFVARQPMEAIEIFLRRLWDLFFRVDIAPSSSLRPDSPLRDLEWIWIGYNVCARAFLFGSVGLALAVLFRSRGDVSRDATKLAFVWLASVAAMASSHVLGFAYFRHLTPLLLPATIVGVTLGRAAWRPVQMTSNQP